MCAFPFGFEGGICDSIVLVPDHCPYTTFHKKYIVSSVCFFFLCFSLITIYRQTSYDSGIPRQDFGIIRDFIGNHQSANFVRLRYPPSRLRNHTKFAYESYEVCRSGHHLGSTVTETGGSNYRIGLDYAGRIYAAIAGSDSNTQSMCFNASEDCRQIQVDNVLPQLISTCSCIK